LHDIDVQDSSSTTSTCKSKDCDISGGLPLAEELDSGGDTIASHYYAADGNGNITLMTTESGTVEGAWRYSTYGGPITYSGAPTPSTFATRNPFRFSTKYMDHEVETRGGIYYYGYRHYSPELGRWLSRDPIAERGGINLYGMVGNDAVNLVDPWGLEKKEPCCNREKRDEGEDSLKSQAGPLGESSRENEYSCDDTANEIFNQLKIPECWRCRVECRTLRGMNNPNATRLQKLAQRFSRPQDWNSRSINHCVIMCQARDENGDFAGEIMIDEYKYPQKSPEGFREKYPHYTPEGHDLGCSSPWATAPGGAPAPPKPYPSTR
jgi:RHS repeat-associated protein